jgi:Fungal Zn(2)-Cys(6) binuclear cluster domain
MNMNQPGMASTTNFVHAGMPPGIDERTFYPSGAASFDLPPDNYYYENGSTGLANFDPSMATSQGYVPTQFQTTEHKHVSPQYSTASDMLPLLPPPQNEGVPQLQSQLHDFMGHQSSLASPETGGINGFQSQNQSVSPNGGRYQAKARFVGPPPVPLACTECRSRHLKCDAKSPSCTRCSTDARECCYIKSRRGWKGSKAPKKLDQRQMQARKAAAEAAQKNAESRNGSIASITSNDSSVTMTGKHFYFSFTWLCYKVALFGASMHVIWRKPISVEHWHAG